MTGFMQHGDPSVRPGWVVNDRFALSLHFPGKTTTAAAAAKLNEDRTRERGKIEGKLRD